ncbi:HPr-rel-A system PqqD family peptide chaperone [Aquiflexum gelatinilyticum]|uniref:HPr-rel-A system PqqD family peptide chaperone n=1 Tax=Aquiflexum gelatinilyticum TaxID=2961943 RepID=UPI00216967F8|nr:HPr-rel-A system PqqD family peptide chaperone [Aquiflexum gelatinilyticum]MCS4433425.1 HPr-rel-A system PqqD family peptide chaperone [Aquiflexum gelatinilyticum]
MVKIKKNIAISDSGFVFDPGSGDSYSLNPSGLEIVHLIKSGKDFKEILETVTEKYEVDSDSFERYYYDFVATLDQLHLTDPNGKD